MVARICLPLVSLWSALRSGWQPSPHALSLRIDRSRLRALQQRNDIYGLENDDKMQTYIFWSTSKAVPMSCTALELRCDAENDIQMRVGTQEFKKWMRIFDLISRPQALIVWPPQ